MAKLDDRMETVKSHWVHSVQYMYRLETRENTMGIGDYNLVIRDYTMANYTMTMGDDRLETRENTMAMWDYTVVMWDYTMAMGDDRLETRENTMAMWHYTVGSMGKSPSQEGKGHG